MATFGRTALKTVLYARDEGLHNLSSLFQYAKALQHTLEGCYRTLLECHSDRLMSQTHSNRQSITSAAYYCRIKAQCLQETGNRQGFQQSTAAEHRFPAGPHRAMRRMSGNLILESWNCLMLTRLQAAAGTVAVLMICMHGARTRCRDAISCARQAHGR